MIASIAEASKSFGEQEVLRSVSAQVHEGDRIGLIGANGTGKSTLLSLLLKEQEPDSGDVYSNPQCRIGYLRQNSGLDVHSSILEEMRSVFAGALAAQERMDELAGRIEKDPHDVSLQKAYDSAMSEFLAADGYHIDVKIRRILNGMGFGEESEDKLIDTMSGGEKTRLALAKLLLQEPDLLVLDEPTNHLDMATLGWLEDYLLGYKGAILVVSHDRFFLDRVVNSIWEIEAARLETYKGNYSKYRVTKKERVKGQVKEYEKQQNQIASMEEYIRRNGVRASTAQLAKSREKQLEKIERIEKPRLHRELPHFSFHSGRQPVQEVLNVHGLDLKVGKERRRIVSGLDMQVRRGERVAVIGANGTGKSTLLHTLLDSVGSENGPAVWGRNVSIGYYDQENKDLDPRLSVVDELMKKRPQLLSGDARSILGSVLLRGEEVFKSVGDLSGGERAKVGFAILMAQDANVLMLDEPTNHLDLDAREALEDALREYEGTLIFVSHDRYFINALAEKVLAIEQGKGKLVEGNYDSYLAQAAPLQAQTPSDSTGRPPSKSVTQKEMRRLQAQGRQALHDSEVRLGELEAEMEELKDQIANQSTDYAVLQTACARLEELNAEYDLVMEQWIEAEEALKKLTE